MLVSGMTTGYTEQMANDTPFPARLGDPPEPAELAARIAANPMLDGTTIRLDGGIGMRPSRVR